MVLQVAAVSIWDLTCWNVRPAAESDRFVNCRLDWCNAVNLCVQWVHIAMILIIVWSGLLFCGLHVGVMKVSWLEVWTRVTFLASLGPLPFCLRVGLVLWLGNLRSSRQTRAKRSLPPKLVQVFPLAGHNFHECGPRPSPHWKHVRPTRPHLEVQSVKLKFLTEDFCNERLSLKQDL